MSDYKQGSLFDLLEELEKEKPKILLTEDEIFELADVDLIKQIQEDRRIERKPASFQPQHVADYIVMWSNTPPNGGLLVVGIQDDGTLEGLTSKGIKRVNKLESVSLDFCPDSRYESKRVAFTHENGNQDFILLFRCQYIGNKVVLNNKGEAFDRKGDNKRQLKAIEIRELQISKGELSFENEHCNLPYPHKFDLNLIQDYADAFRKHRNTTLSYTNEDILEITRLGKIKNKRFIPNNACAIVFAKDPREIISGCHIRFLRFEGEEEGTGDRWNAQKDIWIDAGSIPHQVKEAQQVIESQLRSFTRLGKDDGKFHTAPEYPPYAWYEALVNACVHRSYGLRNMNIYIKMFDDRLEIESPGGFPGVVNAENIYTTHYPRNPHLFEAMYYLGFVKGVREGTRRMKESMEAMELPPPEFVQMKGNHHTVVVRLRNEYKHRKVWLDSDAITVVGEALFTTLTQDEKRAINFIAEHGEISVSNLQRLTQRTWHSARDLLKGLVDRGILTSTHSKNKVKKLGRDTAARYILKR